jgi:N-acetyl-anhydromuramyl-L-alanine amidase AmpD
MKLKRVLTLRMSGEDVTLLQTMLKEHGFFNERIDGNFGQNLLVSVTNFQRAIGTKADGIVGSLTWNKLMNFGKPVLIQNEIPYEISYVNQNGLTVYNYSLSSDLYYQEDVKKETIWLHNTGGGSRPDWSINGWEKEFEKDLSGDPILDQIGRVKPLKVGVSYIIGRKSSSIDEKIWDGKILNTFDDKYWAYHLGINSNQSLDLNSKSIGIEFCNYGPLTLGIDGRFYNSVNKVVNEKEVVKLNRPYRGYDYFERYTESQLESARALILHLINKHAIKIDGKIYNENWFNYNSYYHSNGGIRSHSHIRKDVFDIFPQKEMIQMLNSL